MLFFAVLLRSPAVELSPPAALFEAALDSGRLIGSASALAVRMRLRLGADLGMADTGGQSEWCGSKENNLSICSYELSG